ncbi:metal-dependent hydrolase [Haloarcula amylolytica]|uniref:Putative membrane-bound metal-dependent hydrolase n=1 Tax=Haloarcula amylolytica JCM 13557 TaxID=1227452 RepID=M0KEX5_9EURY|nr:metal-dependent hydrolase [Haloarcula amylolytica]EMA19393.1 putative membrane-bound metal-dependent hydrolase [Haloarcula amylolytica JCM 13557]
MADLLTHLLVPYILLTVASWRVDWLDQRWVIVGMGGAAIPDLIKLEIVLEEKTVESILGHPFSYDPLSTLGGVLLLAGVITVAFERRHWRRVFGLVTFGGLTSLLLDGIRVYADGRASVWLYPFTNWRPPTPSLYVSSDPTVLVVALLAAGTVAVVDRRIQASN